MMWVMASTIYIPPLDDHEMIRIARQRGLLGADETLRQGHQRVAIALGELDRSLGGDPGFAGELLGALLAGRIAVSSQLFAAAGRSEHAAACTVLPSAGTTDDSRLRRLLAEADAASRRGMGCGADLTDFDDPLKALMTLNAATQELASELAADNLRPPALMVSCRADHPQIENFIRAKWNADFSNWVANISVRMTGSDLEWQRLRPLLAEGAHRNGEPGVLFQDVADADNPTPQLALTSTAPCAEVFLAPGEACIFVSVNVAAHVRFGVFEWEKLDASVRLAVRTADAAVELAASAGAPIVAARRRIGIGVCGYHSALIRLGIPYANSATLARCLAERVTFAAHHASASLARVRGPFPLLDESRWTDPTWVARKAERRVGAVDPRAWDALTGEIARSGIRHSAVVAYPPTGVVALLLGVSRSYEPHFSLAGRTGVASKFAERLAPEISEVLARRSDGAELAARICDLAADYQLPGARPTHVLACARQIPPRTHLAIHAAFAGLADESGSKTINLPATTTVHEVEDLLEIARAEGLKGVTVFRDRCLNETKENAA
jgi:ribonucleoside-diphosphate reductase alpha chain